MIFLYHKIFRFNHHVLPSLLLVFVLILILLFCSDLLSRIDLDELMKKDEPLLIFPKTLEEFEYAFNERKCWL